MIEPISAGLALSRSRLMTPALAIDALATFAPWPTVAHAAHWSIAPVALLALAGAARQALRCCVSGGTTSI